jgi:hypothetical protein
MVTAFADFPFALLERYLRLKQAARRKILAILFAKQISRSATFKLALFGNVQSYGNLRPRSTKGKSKMAKGL